MIVFQIRKYHDLIFLIFIRPYNVCLFPHHTAFKNSISSMNQPCHESKQTPCALTPLALIVFFACVTYIFLCRMVKERKIINTFKGYRNRYKEKLKFGLANKMEPRKGQHNLIHPS